MRVLIAGGGTGGHIYPGITIGKALQEKGATVLFVGTEKGLEGEIVPREGFELQYISVDYFPRKLSLRLLKSGLTMFKGFADASKIVRTFRPDICIGTGGYVAGPVVVAAFLQRVPTLIQEQNAYPGLTNRWLGRVASRIALGYEESHSFFKNKDKLVTTGNPIRQQIVDTTRAEGLARLGLRSTDRLVLIFGASQGARSINDAVLQSLPDFNRLDMHFLVATGQSGWDEFERKLSGLEVNVSNEKDGAKRVGNVRIVPYIHDMAAALAGANLVVCRASAGSIAEVTAKGIPSILIPYPHAAENHQEINARVLEKNGAARVITDAELNGSRLIAEIAGLINDKKRMTAMSESATRHGRPDAVWDIVALIEGIVSGAKRGDRK